ncbi:hypothetical protein ATANTOWER_028589 [Ataeniobius toweri]|uniref:Uncharacterized protein n=1 Tax=Ataeniobius toweri TaxID=208326 RepID=A0ABU7C410_9TELE|nr:hypothetical protein [Ataeniobius toweri]
MGPLHITHMFLEHPDHKQARHELDNDGGFVEKMWDFGGVSCIPILTRFFMLSVKSRRGESGLNGDKGEVGGVWGEEGLGSFVGAMGGSTCPAAVWKYFICYCDEEVCHSFLHGSSLSQQAAVVLKNAVLSVVLFSLVSCL